MEKRELVEILTNFLVETALADGGWGSEAASRHANPLNTAEVILGLLRADQMSDESCFSLSAKYENALQSGVKYLQRTQLDNGGWARGAAYLMRRAEGSLVENGNVVSTGVAVWAISAYSYRHGFRQFDECLNNAYGFIRGCIGQDGKCIYGPNYDDSPVASAYCLLALCALCGRLPGNTADLIKDILPVAGRLVEDVIYYESDAALGKIACMIALFALSMLPSRMNSWSDAADSVVRYKHELSAYIASLNEQDVCGVVVEDLAVEGIQTERRKFTHYVPYWYTLASIALGEAESGRLEICRTASFKNLLSNIAGDGSGTRSGVRLGIGKCFTWATAQTIIALSYYLSSSDSDDETDGEFDKWLKRINKVMVIHGRDSARKSAILSDLSELKIEPLEWNVLVGQMNVGSCYTLDVVNKGFEEAQAYLILFTGDDEGRCRADFHLNDDGGDEKELTPQPRMNVIFEAGMAIALHRDRTVIVKMGKVRNFSDIGGINFIKRDDVRTEEYMSQLKTALMKCGCMIIE